jgi:TolB protein
VLVASDRDGDWALYAVDPATGASQRIMHSDAGYSGSRALPSPDGREVLMPEGGGSSAFVVGVDGRGSRRLRTSYWQEAAWSPDTKRIALDGQPGIAVVRRDGTHRTMVTDAEGNQPAWSPDGKRIAYSGSNGLEIVDADGGTPKRFPTGYLADQAAWSPDGREVAFVGAESNRGRLLAVDVDSGRIRELARGARGPISWSPDGARLLYLRNSRPGAVFVVDADGSSSRRIAVADRGAYLLDARWSPDGKRIILSSGGAHRPGESELVEVRSMRPDGSGMRRLTRAYGPDGGNNVVLGWVRGDLRKEPRPRPRAAEHVLRVPYEVGVVSAEGGRVAVAPVALYGDVSPLPRRDRFSSGPRRAAESDASSPPDAGGSTS